MSAPIRDLARVTVELQSPLAIGSGAWDDLLDSPFVVDANDLPTLPGTSLAGVLRAAWLQARGEAEAKKVFGHQERDQGEASRVWISFGAIHGQDDRPVAPRMRHEDIERDPLLRLARVPLVRQHVRIDHRGAAEGHGLFDRSMVAAGHRFTFELEVRDEDESILRGLLGLFADGSVGLGARTRSGLGALRLVQALGRRFDLRKKADREAYAEVPADLRIDMPRGVLEPLQPGATGPSTGELVARLELRPRGFWMIGGGRPAEGAGKAPDINPYREARVVWEKGQGRLDLDRLELVVPASAIKGALRHRAAFHLNRLQRRFADQAGAALERFDGTNHPDVQSLFGCMLEHDEGQAGRVRVGDLRFAKQPDSQRMTHVSLDRFTCGPVDGALFEEEALWKGGPWQLEVRVQTGALGAGDKRVPDVPLEAREALRLALEDLVGGRLQIGAGSGRGHGWLEGKLDWQGREGWLRGEEG
ncbi:MAG TPA: RAMP superfamily CRISPR-associated protein [Myxococcota bacterium]|nr:RAMP superfamily CRISPR-associated protein [Myxococcota bacterium]HRY96635.1 RAMP superfamily CRISPR-associated protein [Myxococcota bacterium]